MDNNVLMLLLLMAVRVSCSSYNLQDAVSTTTYGPFDTENRSDQEVIREFVKMKILEGLGIQKPPVIPPEPTAILKDDVRSLPLSSYRHPRNLDIQGGTRKFSRVIVFPELGSDGFCRVSKRMLKTYIPATFKLPSDPSMIRRAILQFKTGTEKKSSKAKRKVWICSCKGLANHTENRIRGTTDTATDFRLQTSDCQQLAVTSHADRNTSNPKGPIKSTRQGWSYVHLEDHWNSFVSGQPGMDRRLFFLLDGKSNILERTRLSLVLEVEKEMNRAKRNPSMVKSTEQELEVDDCRPVVKTVDEIDGETRSSSPCCRSKFWVDIEQLGWSDWILSPPGFYYYFCAGECRNGFDSITKGAGLDYSKVLNAMIVKHKITSIRPCCTARKTSPLSVVMVTDRNSVNRTLIPNFIVDECACIGFA